MITKSSSIQGGMTLPWHEPHPKNNSHSAKIMLAIIFASFEYAPIDNGGDDVRNSL
jgi:hypothetical protein